MVPKLQSFLFQFLNKRKHYSDEELHNYVLMLAVSVVACLVHVAFTAFFFFAGSTLLSISHLVGVFVFLLAFWLLQHRHYDIAGVLLSVMILLSSFATIFSIGGNNFSILYQFLVLLMQMVIPFSKRKIPIITAALLPPLMVCGYLYDLHFPPLYSIGAANNVLAILNILFNSSGMVLLLSLDRLVRGFLENFKTQKLKELETQAIIDPLTGLYNRRYADAYFNKISATPPQGESFVAIADIDDFKLINDTFGHDTGDAALRVISEVFIHNTRKSDVVFRWGGEEFLLIIHNVTSADAFRLMDKIRALICETTIEHKENIFRVSITMGLALLVPSDIPRSLESCDQKLYAGKRGTKNVVVM